MKFLEKLLKANPENDDTLTLSHPKLYIEISAIPGSEEFCVAIPALGRWFAHTYGETLVEALKDLDILLADVITDEEHREAYKEKGIIIPSTNPRLKAEAWSE